MRRFYLPNVDSENPPNLAEFIFECARGYRDSPVYSGNEYIDLERAVESAEEYLRNVETQLQEYENGNIDYWQSLAQTAQNSWQDHYSNSIEARKKQNKSYKSYLVMLEAWAPIEHDLIAIKNIAIESIKQEISNSEERMEGDQNKLDNINSENWVTIWKKFRRDVLSSQKSKIRDAQTSLKRAKARASRVQEKRAKYMQRIRESIEVSNLNPA